MTFIDYGPGVRLRLVRSSTCSLPVPCIYSSSNGCITIERFSFDSNSRVYGYYEYLYKSCFKDDKQLTMMTSTSPEQERPTFVKNMKKTIKYVLSYHQLISEWFQNNDKIMYKKESSLLSPPKWTTASPVIEDIDIG